mmetsp:Transcript_29875/g.62409  ORF Transcript_29875/g.62409 Transcript_29875/m.62409 type:complete len:274 (-) Transcript_29875:105-926(-)
MLLLLVLDFLAVSAVAVVAIVADEEGLFPFFRLPDVPFPARSRSCDVMKWESESQFLLLLLLARPLSMLWVLMPKMSRERSEPSVSTTASPGLVFGLPECLPRRRSCLPRLSVRLRVRLRLLRSADDDDGLLDDPPLRRLLSRPSVGVGLSSPARLDEDDDPPFFRLRLRPSVVVVVGGGGGAGSVVVVVVGVVAVASVVVASSPPESDAAPYRSSMVFRSLSDCMFLWRRVAARLDRRFVVLAEAAAAEAPVVLSRQPSCCLKKVSCDLVFL